LPLAWSAEEGVANIGFEGQRRVLERVRQWLPVGAAVILLADRFYPSNELFASALGSDQAILLKYNRKRMIYWYYFGLECPFGVEKL
jgi:hypothetical protein